MTDANVKVKVRILTQPLKVKIKVMAVVQNIYNFNITGD